MELQRLLIQCRPLRFGQAISPLALTNIPWPEGLKKTLQWFSSMNLEISLIPSAACMLDGTSFLGQLLLYGLAPVLVVLVSHCVHSCVFLALTCGVRMHLPACT